METLAQVEIGSSFLFGGYEFIKTGHPVIEGLVQCTIPNYLWVSIYISDATWVEEKQV